MIVCCRGMASWFHSVFSHHLMGISRAPVTYQSLSWCWGRSSVQTKSRTFVARLLHPRHLTALASGHGGLLSWAYPASLHKGFEADVGWGKSEDSRLKGQAGERVWVPSEHPRARKRERVSTHVCMGVCECAHARVGVFVRCRPDGVRLSSPALLTLLRAPSTKEAF